MKETYLLNAFSLQMIEVKDLSLVKIERVETLPEGLISAIGHKDTAAVLGVEMNRINIHLDKGDVCYVAQLQGGRLPEGSTTLPEGYEFVFYKVTVGIRNEIENALYDAYDDGNLDGACGFNVPQSAVKEIMKRF